MSDETAQARVPERRWKLPKWGWALFGLSMGLNLLIVGSFIGIRWAGHHHGWHGGGYRHIIRDLPAKQREFVQSGLENVRAENRAAMSEIVEKRRALKNYVKGDAIDPAELERRIKEINALRNARRVRFQNRIGELTVQIVGDLSPEMRQRVIKKVVGGHRRRHGRRWRNKYRD